MPKSELLVAVDLTEEAIEVLAAARTLSDMMSGELTVVTVLQPLTMIYNTAGIMAMGPVATQMESRAIEQATIQLCTLGAEYGVPPERCKILIGSPAAEIRREAENGDSDIIVIGTHGRHGLGLVLGSTANAVLHGAPCDVLAVRIHPVDA